MESNEDYQRVWLRKLDEFIKRNDGAASYQRYMKTPDEFSEEIGRSVQRVLERQGIEPAIRNRVLEALKNDHGYQDASQALSTVARRHRELRNIEAQTTRSDIESKARFLIFRMLTALGIAVVVLLTGYLAKTLDIPLPLLRV